MNDVPKGLK